MRTVNAMLATHYGRFNPFQLVRLLQWTRAGAMPRLDDAGARRRLRFKADLSAGFPGGEIRHLVIDQDGGEAHLKTANFCLAGTLAPLPEPFTEWLCDQARRRDFASADFLDLFNQRINILRYDLKADLLPELNSAAPEDTEQATYLAALMGLGIPALADQLTPQLPPRAWLALAGTLANARRSAASIAHLVSVVFGVRVRLEQWVGTWRTVEAIDRCALGVSNSTLGRRAVLGRRIWDQQARVRLTIPDIDYQRACALLPAEPHATEAPTAHRHLRALLRLLLDREFDCEVRLQLAPASIQSLPPRLSARPDRSRDWGLRLGQTAWLGRPGDSACAAFLVPAYDPQEAP